MLPLEGFGITKDVLLMTVPSILAEIVAGGPESIETLRQNVCSVIYAGATLPDVVGDKLANHGVIIQNVFGM